MTRRSYPPIAQGPVVTCPCCRRMLEITGYNNDDGEPVYLDDASLHATAVPLRDQPCIAHAPSAYHPGAGKVGYVRSVAVGGAVCSWLGPTCNDASHVTPCYAAWYARRPTCSRVARDELVGVGHDTCIGSET